MKKYLGIACVVGSIVGGMFLAASPSEAQWYEDSEVYDGTKLTGSWSMASVVDLTTCTSETVGDKSSKAWELTFGDGEVKIKSSSGNQFTANEPSRYSSKDKFVMKVTPVKTPNSAVYEFKLQDKAGKKFSGRMIAAGTDGCVSLSTVTLTKL